MAADTAVSDLELEQTKAESDLEPVRERLARNQRRIADGSVPDAKALSSMVAEVDHLKKRIGDLEDAELEVMEQLEQAVAERDRLRVRVDELAACGGRGRPPGGTSSWPPWTRRSASGVRNARRIAPTIEPTLLALYDKIAASHGGVGAAELRARRCTGCQLEVNAADLRRVRRGARRRGAALRGVQPDPGPDRRTRDSERARREVGLPDGAAPELAARPGRHPGQARGAGRVPGGGARGGRAGGRRARGCPIWTGPTSSSSRSTREGSRDLDQAVHITRDDSGFVVSYAIADVAAFVAPGTRSTWRPTAAG